MKNSCSSRCKHVRRVSWASWRLLSPTLLLLLSLAFLLLIVSGAPVCGPGKKLNLNRSTKWGESNSVCVTIDTHDMLSAMHGLTRPPSTVCKKQVTVQGIPVCEDHISTVTPDECNVVSILMTENCDESGSFEFEKYWGAKCNVYIYHMTTYMTGCAGMKGRVVNIDDNKNIKILRNLVWQGGCFNCVYKAIDSKLMPTPSKIDILKIQRLDRPFIKDDIYDGAQYTVLADLFIHLPHWMELVQQVVFTASMTSISLTDNVGREAEHGWNMWASRMFLQYFASFSTTTDAGTFLTRPLQFDYLLSKIPLDTQISFYHHSMMRVTDNTVRAKNAANFTAWKPVPVPALHAEVPRYCTSPTGEADENMQQWIVEELNVRCHPFRLAVPCDFSRTHEAFIPCQQELINHLAEDYAAMKGWCNFKSHKADIPALKVVDAGAAAAFKRPYFEKSERKVRIAFMFTVYADSKYVKRLLSLLYGPDHYYLLHIDPTGASKEFEDEMRQVGGVTAILNWKTT
jgi:hypothetical protein